MKLVIHEFANLYPMLSEEELQEMADDIAQNGQQNPIIIKNGVLIDGRNRLAACKLAGIEPLIQEYDEDLDESGIKSLVLSLNNNRRHLSKGQKAMSVAIAYPDPEKGGRGNSLKIKEFDGLNSGYISQARKILKFAPIRVSEVMSGAIPTVELIKKQLKGFARSKSVIESRQCTFEGFEAPSAIEVDGVFVKIEHATRMQVLARISNVRENAAKIAASADREIRNLNSLLDAMDEAGVVVVGEIAMVTA